MLTAGIYDAAGEFAYKATLQEWCRRRYYCDNARQIQFMCLVTQVK